MPEVPLLHIIKHGLPLRKYSRLRLDCGVCARMCARVYLCLCARAGNKAREVENFRQHLNYVGRFVIYTASVLFLS